MCQDAAFVGSNCAAAHHKIAKLINSGFDMQNRAYACTETLIVMLDTHQHGSHEARHQVTSHAEMMIIVADVTLLVRPNSL